MATATDNANSLPKQAPHDASSPSSNVSPAQSALQEDQAAILASVISLAALFSTAAEALTLIHPSTSTHPQKLALTRLGLQQGRLLIFGDVVGISSPPATIATHFVPSHAGLTNPDPSLPINFGARDPRLDQDDCRKKVEACLEEIVGRPEKLGRDEMMATYGLKAPRRTGAVGEKAVDLNRLEAFREKYSLLQDLSHKKARIQMPRRGMSMTTQHWTVKDVDKFNSFITMVKVQVDQLVALFGVDEQVEKGMRIDIKSLGWHPDMSGPIMKRDWEKLKMIREACEEEYPTFLQATETALRYINQQLRGKAQLPLKFERVDKGLAVKEEKRPGLLSLFKSGSWKKRRGSERSQSISSTTSNPAENAPRSMSQDVQKDSMAELEPVRSKSLSAIPGKTTVNIDSVLVKSLSNESTASAVPAAVDDPDYAQYQLMHADTAHSLVDRHDMWHGPGRIPTKDIRWVAKTAEEH